MIYHYHNNGNATRGQHFLHIFPIASPQSAGLLQIIYSNTRVRPFRNRTGARVGNQVSLQYEIGHVGDDSTRYETPTALWLKDGIPFRVKATNTNTMGINGRLVSQVSFRFMESDAGVYQCVFTDPVIQGSEIFISVPTRVDTG